MAFEHNNMSGSLFKNDKKEKDTQPDYRGSCKVDGKTYDVSMWIGTTKDGARKMLNLKFQEPYKKPEPAPAPASAESETLPF